VAAAPVEVALVALQVAELTALGTATRTHFARVAARWGDADLTARAAGLCSALALKAKRDGARWPGEIASAVLAEPADPIALASACVAAAAAAARYTTPPLAQPPSLAVATALLWHAPHTSELLEAEDDTVADAASASIALRALGDAAVDAGTRLSVDELLTLAAEQHSADTDHAAAVRARHLRSLAGKARTLGVVASAREFMRSASTRCDVALALAALPDSVALDVARQIAGTCGLGADEMRRTHLRAVLAAAPSLGPDAVMTRLGEAASGPPDTAALTELLDALAPRAFVARAAGWRVVARLLGPGADAQAAAARADAAEALHAGQVPCDWHALAAAPLDAARHALRGNADAGPALVRALAARRAAGDCHDWPAPMTADALVWAAAAGDGVDVQWMDTTPASDAAAALEYLEGQSSVDATTLAAAASRAAGTVGPVRMGGGWVAIDFIPCFSDSRRATRRLGAAFVRVPCGFESGPPCLPTPRRPCARQLLPWTRTPRAPLLSRRRSWRRWPMARCRRLRCGLWPKPQVHLRPSGWQPVCWRRWTVHKLPVVRQPRRWWPRQCLHRQRTWRVR
jgi:hypothetical protein